MPNGICLYGGQVKENLIKAVIKVENLIHIELDYISAQHVMSKCNSVLTNPVKLPGMKYLREKKIKHSLVSLPYSAYAARKQSFN